MKNSKLHLSHLFILFVIGLLVIAASCKKKEVVADVGGDKIYLSDFEKQLLKSIPSIDSAKKLTLDQKKEFLDLLIKFRLKVKDARERGLLNSEDIQNDIKEYKDNFISSFLIDKEIVNPAIKDLYDQKKYEVRASHILINLPQRASAEDSIKAYQKAEEIMKKLKDGADFSTVAREFSEDQTVKQNGGDLYYFTAGMTVPEFEEEVFKLKVGEISKKPIRTMYGLHIVKLTDKKKRDESRKASHILIQDQKDSLGQTIDSIGTYNKAKMVLDRIKKGEDFANLAREFSQDPGSAPQGGDLGYFERRRMVQSFDSVAFTLKKDQISELVRSPFGWHIIKVTDIKEYSSFDDQEDKLKSDFKKGKLYKDKYKTYILELQKKYDFVMNQDGLNFLSSKFDSTKTFGSFKLDSLFANDLNMTIATYKDGKITVQNLITYLNRNRDYISSLANRTNIENIVKASVELPLLNLEAEKQKIEKDEEFVEVLTEYENGLLSFKVDQEELWSKIKLTDSDLENYYNNNKQKYTYSDSSEVKVKPFNDVKSEISNTLQQEKFIELENAYIEKLKQKYPIKINDKVLEKAFK